MSWSEKDEKDFAASMRALYPGVPETDWGTYRATAMTKAPSGVPLMTASIERSGRRRFVVFWLSADRYTSISIQKETVRRFRASRSLLMRR